MSDKIEAKVGGKVLITANLNHLRNVSYSGKARKGETHIVSAIDGDGDICLLNDKLRQWGGPYLGPDLYEVIE